MIAEWKQLTPWQRVWCCVAFVAFAAVPACAIEAVWSGEWRWLLGMLPGIIGWRAAG